MTYDFLLGSELNSKFLQYDISGPLKHNHACMYISSIIQMHVHAGDRIKIVMREVVSGVVTIEAAA